MATLKNLLDNGLKVGALVKAFDTVFQYAGKDLFRVVKTKNKEFEKYAQCIDLDFIEYLCLDTFNGELTSAYDCGIPADELPIPEPVDVTGWVVDSEGYKHQIEHWHKGDVNYSSGFDEETEMQPDYFEFTDGAMLFCTNVAPAYHLIKNISSHVKYKNMLDLEKLKVGDIVQDSRPEYMDKWKLIEKRKVFWFCECIDGDKKSCFAKGEQEELNLGITFWQLVESAPEQPQPEAWQPKHGDIVWNTMQKRKHAIIEIDGKMYLFGRHSNGEMQWLEITDDDRKYKYLEPYTNQDAPQWPKTWEELGTIKGYWINDESEINLVVIEDSDEIETKTTHRNIFVSVKHAKSALAGAMLSQIAARMNDGFEKDWTDGVIKAYTVCCNDAELYTEYYTTMRHNIYFKTEEMAEFSLKHHLQLWKDYWMLD